jgi:hypothetical protein
MSFPGQSNSSMLIKDAVLRARRTLHSRLSNLLGLSAKERALSAPVVADPDRHGIALVAIVKDEARYISEWIAFHANLGVRSIYIYDNGSTDETVALAQGGRLLADVRVIPWMNFGRHIRIQTSAYNHAAANFGRRYRWMMFLDVDEFVFPKEGGDLNETMAAYEGLPAVSFPWQMFGPSGHRRRPDGLVVEAYRERAAFPFSPENTSLLNYKTIADPTAIKWAHTHYCELWDDDGAMYNDAGQRFWRFDRFNPKHATAERIQLNHYFTRSYEEFEQKIAKRRVSKEGLVDHRSGLQGQLECINRRTVRDDGAARFAGDVKAVLAAAERRSRPDFHSSPPS